MDVDPAHFTLGVEEEFQLVDAATGALQSRARGVLAWDWTGEIKPEMQQNTVEVGTRVCHSAAEARGELARLRFQTAVAAEARGLRLLAAGTHPFSGWQDQTFTPGAVYDSIHREYRRLAETQNIFGMHVHVAVPAGTDRARVMNVVRWYLPHLLALSVSSPYFLGEDTGYASYRAVLWSRWPRSGPPPRFADQAEFATLVHLLMQTRSINAPGRLYWHLRPHHDYPTVEFRVADVTPRLADAVVVAALARGLVAAAVAGLLHEPPGSDAVLRPLLIENVWRASRDGLGAELITFRGAEPAVVSVRAALADLVPRLEPVVRALGDAEQLTALAALLQRGDAARRMRTEAAEQADDLRHLVHWIARETLLGTGLDRRAEQREEPHV